jgi:hypothetical protein
MIIINLKSKIIADVSKKNLTREFLENLNQVLIINDCYAEKETEFNFRAGSILDQIHEVLKICILNKTNFLMVDLESSIFNL